MFGHADVRKNARKGKLSAIYQFIRGMPSIYIESRLRQQLNEIRAKKMEFQRQHLELQRQQLEIVSKLEEVGQQEQDLMRRL